MIAIIVYGSPAPQGSKKPGFMTKSGRPSMQESSKHVKPWREAVKEAALVVLGPYGPDRRPLDEPVWVDMVFTFRRPKAHYRTGRNAHLLRDGAPARPSGYPDVSKLARSTEDALADAGVIRNDSLIVEYRRLAKVWEREDRAALEMPGVAIRICTREEALSS